MLVLGIEGTAHTVGVSIVDGDGEVLSNVFETYQEKEGIHPREAANHHSSKIVPLIREALEESNVGRDEVDLVAFSQGPGLGPCLRTVATAARSLSLSLDVPLVGVNHCIAHLEIGRLRTEAESPVLLYVSGGNTQIIAFTKGRYRVFGETLDIGLGNMLDKFGRDKGMNFPAGPVIEKKARGGDELLDLPYSVKGMDVEFSGIMTSALNLDEPLEDICYSIQETTFAMLTEVTERALAHTRKNEVLLGGGVVQNKRLQEMIEKMTEERGATSFVPEPEFCVDNPAMIAWTGYLMYDSGTSISVEESNIRQKFRTDEVEVTWRG
ncbi:MAG: bifunctional N(6)-L-threonylcarbamoyladenine synthase/serine/threonine protein kinase [Candidatus Thermoplasmatota archaeon]|nr:bifunctional N(6)-L-threonylcarbamoyladenine synthase/serine/threonine protein kinase [Candidatus Thermoplasmatota archaeon]